MDDLDLVRRFTYHRPRREQPRVFAELRGKALELARLINSRCPESTEKIVAIDRLEETVMWANAGIARAAACDPACEDFAGERSAG